MNTGSESKWWIIRLFGMSAMAGMFSYGKGSALAAIIVLIAPATVVLARICRADGRPPEASIVYGNA